MDMFEDKTILITGGTGSWGNELSKQLLLQNPREIRIFSRGEFAQVTMQRKFNDERLSFIIGDIRDAEAINDACYDVDYVYHLAALKHVPICEDLPLEAIKTNILGTENLIKAAKNNGVKKVIDVSTDKAVVPINTYGMCKALGEKLIVRANVHSPNTRFICIRGGNVLGTNGSVVPYFIDMIKRFNKVTITDLRMTRYFITLEEAIGLLFKASEQSIGGETFVMQMPSYRISDLANVLIEIFGDNETQIEVIGSRPGEKIDEVLVSKYESSHTYEFGDNYYLILPLYPINSLSEHYEKQNLNKVTFEEYSSATNVMDKTEIRMLLEKGGFLD